MARRLGEFAEKDRVRLRTVLDATRGDDEARFVWCGARWRVSRGQLSVEQRDGRGGPHRSPSTETRVIVSRASGLAKLSDRGDATAGRPAVA